MVERFSFMQLQKQTKPGRYFDPVYLGLHLWIKDQNRKYWIFRFTIGGKRQDMSLGAFPRKSLADAHRAANEARLLLDEGKNPLEMRKFSKIVEREEEKTLKTFKEFASEWLEDHQYSWQNEKHRDQWANTLSTYAFPIIGDMPIEVIQTEHIVKILKPLWVSKTETATRLRGRIERILAAATILKLRQGPNPAAWRGTLDTLLPSPSKVATTEHHAALDFMKLPEFIDRLRGKSGLAALALEFAILTAARTGEVLNASRDEIVQDVWTVPAKRMKARKEHRVPLTRRALQIIEIAKSLDPDSNFLFSRNRKPLSNMAMSKVLRQMQVEVTVHGFRSTFRDWVSEKTNHSPELAEMALAHTIMNKVEAAYRRGDLLERRRQLMDDWASYCDSKVNL
ncbi:MAG: integrase arm-type DNA-binding domain-containing protein [Alphaproteobacteria bacterium]